LCTGAITENPEARMQWKYYWRNVVQRYSVKIEGWPKEFPFTNLSDASSTLTNLEALLHKWQNGTVFWRKLSTDELGKLNTERACQLENGEISAPTPRRPRSDQGKKRSTNEKRGKKKSPQTIDTDSSDEE
jgi:hypothetical protein